MGKACIKLAFLLQLISIVRADDFIVMSSSEFLTFEDSTEPLPRNQIKHILWAIAAESASAGVEFYSMKINNIFKIPKLALVMTVKLNSTADYTGLGTVHKYSIEGRTPGTTLLNVLNFEKSSTYLEFYKTSKDTEFEYLKQMLTTAGAPGGEDIVPDLKKLLTTDVLEELIVDFKMQNFIGMHLFNQQTGIDFSKLVEVLNKLKESWKDYFFGILTYGPDLVTPESAQNISTITTIDPIDHVHYNIPPRYDENYAIIFNIIFWFMIAFSLALYAIILSLINMDPGRDSIIYRMTARRSKKDI